MDLEKVEQAFADAALDPTRWNDAMAIASAVTGGFGALLLPVAGEQIPQVPISNSIGEVAEAYFKGRWYDRDERNKGVSLLIKRGLTGDLDIFSEDYINSHAYYQEFLAPFRLRWFAGIRVACGEDVWCLSIQRTISQGPFSRSDKRELVRLSQTLSSSAAMAKAVGFAAGNATLDVLEASGSAAVLINRQGEIFQMNRSAESMLMGEVCVVNRRLVARDSRSTAAFDRALRDLLWMRSTAALSPPIMLNRQSQYPLLAYLIRPSALAANALADCKAIAILVEVGSRMPAPESTLRLTFNLTEAEARVASRLGAGHSLEDIAREFGVLTGTVRAQLKAIFEKTNTHRQGDLVSLISSVGLRSK